MLPSDQEVGYVKEGVARVVMETAKRMWPQQWPTFLTDLDTLTQCGVCKWGMEEEGKRLRNEAGRTLN